MTDRFRTPLKPNELLEIKEKSGNRFTLNIEKVLGFGGSCIVYTGFKVYDFNSINIQHRLIIKELYPESLDISRDKSGFLIISEEKAEMFGYYQKKFLKGQIYHSEYYENESGSSLPRAFILGEANNTLYAISDPVIGKCLSEIDRETLSICRVATIMESICRAIVSIHRTENLYLDCKPDNIFFFKDTLQDRVFLFDFDTVVAVDELKRGKYKYCSYSHGWSAPEQQLTYSGNDYQNSHLIGYHSDIFSIGLVFFWLLTGRSPEGYENGCIVELENIQHDRFNWKKESSLCRTASDDTIRLIQSLAEKMLCPDAWERRKIFPRNTSIKFLITDFENLYSNTVGDDVHYESLHNEIADVKETLLKKIGEMQILSIDKPSEKIYRQDIISTNGTESIYEVFSQEIAKKERLYELHSTVLTEYNSNPSDISKERLNSIEKSLKKQTSVLENMRRDMIEGLKLTANHIDKEDIDEREKTALFYIANGDYRAANRVLYDNRWKNEIISLDALFSEIKEKCQKFISGQKILISNIMSFGINDESDIEIRKIYALITDLSEKYSISYDTLYDYAKYLCSQSCYSESLAVAKRLEMIYSLHGCQERDKAKLCFLIGKICYSIHDYSEALRYYNSAYDIIALHPENDHEKLFESDILELSQCIADTYWKTNNYLKAEKVLENIMPYTYKVIDADGIIDNSADNKTILNIADIYNRLATMSNAKNNLDSAEKYHLTAIRLKLLLADRNTSDIDTDILLSLSSSYNNIAFVYKKNENYAKANEYYLKAYNIRKNGIENNYIKYAIPFAIVCENYASVFSKMKETEKAEEMMKKYVLPIKQHYYERYNEDYSESLSYSYTDYAVILSESYDASRFDEAEKLFLKAIELKEESEKNRRLTGLRTIAISYKHYGHLLKKEGKAESSVYYSKALDIYQKLEEQNPGYYTYYIDEILGFLNDDCNNSTDSSIQ